MSSTSSVSASSPSILGSSAAGPLLQFSGLGSGIDTQSIIQALVAVEQNKIDTVSAGVTKDNTKLQTWSTITTAISTLKTASVALLHPTDWTPLTASSSDDSVASVSAGSGTLNGTLQFTVDALASAGSVRSANVLSSTTTAVAADQAVLVAAGGGALGFKTFASDDALALGTHTITVTQSSSGATKLGDTALDATTTIAAGDTLTLNVNGTSYTLDNIAAGTYTQSDLAAAIQTAADAKGAGVNVTVDPATNSLSIATQREGSTATFQLTGGTALAKLHLSADATQLVGTDGKVQVDGGAEQVFTDVEAGQTVTLNSTAGTVTATIAGGLRAGTVTANNVSVGDGSLATVVANINAAGAGVTATTVQVGNGTYRLQINSNTTGAANGSNVADSEFNSAVGSLVELTQASDAKITVGSGAGAYSVTSKSNTISGVMPGVTIQLKSQSTTPVTVSVSRDSASLATKVQALVDAANAVHDAIATATAYDASTNTASPLTGDPSAERIISDLALAVTDAVPGANPGSPGLAGLQIGSDGKFTFDQGKFTTAFNTDPTGVMRLFTQGGTSANAGVKFVSAGDGAQAGAYDVNVTALATQADTTGWNGTWPSAGGQVINVRVGSTVISYTTQAGDTQQAAVAELNNRFAQAGFQIQASANGTGIELKTSQYGTAASFDVAWDGVNYNTIAGTNVQGTIGGVAAVGTGQQLAIPWDDPTMGGLSLNITSTVTGDLGDFTYTPGVAQRVSTAMTRATDPISGYVIGAENSLNNDVKNINDRVAQMQDHLVQYQNQLNQQYSNLETVITQLKATGSYLTSVSNAQAVAAKQ